MTTDEIIKEAAGKFCGWKIPKDFYPDCYISIDRDKAFAHPHHGPTGTNLFTFDQAKVMFEHCIGERIAELEKSNAQLLEALEYVDSENASEEVLRHACAAIAEVKP